MIGGLARARFFHCSVAKFGGSRTQSSCMLGAPKLVSKEASAVAARARARTSTQYKVFPVGYSRFRCGRRELYEGRRCLGDLNNTIRSVIRRWRTQNTVGVCEKKSGRIHDAPPLALTRIRTRMVKEADLRAVDRARRPNEQSSSVRWRRERPWGYVSMYHRICR